MHVSQRHQMEKYNPQYYLLPKTLVGQLTAPLNGNACNNLLIRRVYLINSIRNAAPSMSAVTHENKNAEWILF